MPYRIPLHDFKTWLNQFKQSLAQPPATPRVPFYIGQACVGSIEKGIAQRLVEAKYLNASPHAGAVILATPDMANAHTQINQQLNGMAHWLQLQGLAAKWRDEQLPVTDFETGALHGVVERAVIRVLGIRTFAVHLIGLRADGAVWLQRRALSKATDPGKLDTLVGGLVAAKEPFLTALEREAWEEAGIQLNRAETPIPFEKGGEFEVYCPIDTDIGGYMVERCIWHIAYLPDTVMPENQDGEVSEFVCLNHEEIIARMLSGEVAGEAVLILSRLLEKNRSLQQG